MERVEIRKEQFDVLVELLTDISTMLRLARDMPSLEEEKVLKQMETNEGKTSGEDR